MRSSIRGIGLAFVNAIHRLSSEAARRCGDTRHDLTHIEKMRNPGSSMLIDRRETVETPCCTPEWTNLEILDGKAERRSSDCLSTRDRAAKI